MKTKVSAILLILVLIMTSFLSSCGNKEENIITYIETDTTKEAEALFDNKSEEELLQMCQNMASTKEDAQISQNFFMYILAKTTAVNEENIEDLYSLSLKVMERCLKLPISSPAIVSGLKKNSRDIDGKLTEKTKEFLKGQWIRKDNTTLNGMIIDVVEDPELGLIAKIVDTANGSTLQFKKNEIKWKDIHFANHKKFYMSDLASEKTSTVTNGEETTRKIVNTYKGAVAKVDFENHKIKISYTIKADITSGANQTWIKVGFDEEKDGQTANETAADSNAKQ